MKELKKIIEKEFDIEIVSLTKLNSRSKPVAYKVECKDGKCFRLDTGYPLRCSKLQELSRANGVNVPKLLKFVNSNRFRLCEWIDGVVIEKAWYLDDVFVKQGELLAKLNNTCTSFGEYIHNTDTNPTNFIWTDNEEIYFIDFGKALTTSSQGWIDLTAASGAMKNLQYWPWEDKKRNSRGKIELFLEGYKKHRNIENIIEILDTYDWNFKEYMKKGYKVYTNKKGIRVWKTGNGK
jgi:tRNA A-37 threonylcarbamoyl transferase component Bud32